MMKKTEEKIYKEITEYLEKFQPEFRSLNTGFITKVSDGIAIIQGLSKAKMGEILYFPNGILGVALNLKKDEVGAIILDDYSKLIEGDRVISSGKILSIPASTTLLGRVVNPMVQAIDTLGEIKHTKDSASMPIEKIAPGIIFRESVNTPLTTGIKSIDAMIPIGRGQRELIIGDRNTGKTAIAIDTIINQAYGAKYCKATGSEALATTTIVSSIAPISSSFATTCATLDCFCPIAT